MVAFVREWPIVEWLLASNSAQVVLFASDDDAGPDEPAALTVSIPVPSQVRVPAAVAPGARQALVPVAGQILAQMDEEDRRADEATTMLVGAYREGYADGYVDCLTVRGMRR